MSTSAQAGARLLEAAANGDVTTVSAITSGIISLDARDARGWTALMMAARKGHVDVVRTLVDKGCDTEVINHAGQTAREIAAFWNFPDVVRILERAQSQSAVTHVPSLLSPSERFAGSNFFAHAFLDRAAERRKDAEWIAATMEKESTTYVVFNSKIEALVTRRNCDGDATAAKAPFLLYRARYAQVKEYLGLNLNSLVVFLGVSQLGAGSKEGEREGEKEVAGEGEGEWEEEETAIGNAWFALGVARAPEVDAARFDAHASWLGGFPASLQLETRDSGVFAHARSLLAWHDRHGFCPTCGREARVADAGHKRVCSDDSCRSRKGTHNTCYPRVDPTVIMAVVSPEGSRLLLGRGLRFPRGLYSCLAGFIEPGETVEAACRREVQEEAGVQVGRVEYHSCQPWPMPASLMIGCIAHATAEHMQADKRELEDARWFPRHDVISMLNNRHRERLFVPPEQTIAHALIRTWVNMTSNL